ncbi:hypothetical protein AURDEDRAFT_167459 [Auricularia subglabra TFB-10046 SS5]|nr:hypothetical protein AURDEDRAFT_167459 [Auricularia subglabra TFB-10046 SS5]
MTTPNALTANRYPYPKEEALLRAHIASSEDERQLLEKRRQESSLVVETARRDVEAAERVLEAAREALESAQALYNGVAESCRALDARVELARRRLHPIRRVPDDILGEIFQHAVDTSNAGIDKTRYAVVQPVPFALAQVSRRWRAAALAQPRLWQYLNMDMDAVDAGLRRRDVVRCSDAVHDCKWCRFIKVHLLRSKSIPIHLRVVQQGDDYEDNLYHVWYHLAEMTPRVRLLEVYQGGDHTNAMGKLLATGASMPLLETALIDATSHHGPESSEPMNSVFFPSAPRLSTCSVRHFHPTWTSDAQVYPALVSLNFSGGATEDLAPSANQIGDFLSRCPSLERVSICLEYLGQGDVRPRTYPRVKNVSIRVTHDANDLSSALIFPSAQQLDLSLGPHTATRAMITACAASLKVLVIHKRTIAVAAATCLKEVMSLESLELVHCKVSESFCQQLVSSASTLVCPTWSKLHLTECTSTKTPTQDRFTGAALLQLVRTRNDAFAKGENLRRLSDITVSWSPKAQVPLLDGFAERLQALLR